MTMYYTAGSVKLLAECRRLELDNTASATKDADADSDGDGDEPTVLPGRCTTSNTASIASDLAGRTYATNCLERAIEDDGCNYTRFLLLARNGVSCYLTHGRRDGTPVKTSTVFTLPDNCAGALYKALACFSLRDIDFSTPWWSEPASGTMGPPLLKRRSLPGDAIQPADTRSALLNRPPVHHRPPSASSSTPPRSEFTITPLAEVRRTPPLPPPPHSGRRRRRRRFKPPPAPNRDQRTFSRNQRTDRQASY